ncbi:MAG: PQQ-dependent sugar dehydrogenase, partial [Hyphomonadaceae bacterium]|nr:PQQ-dependent sugar dehydrogenase [Hyphomonadaceae bacterium]
MDVALDPDYPDNKWVYLSFSHPLEGSSGPSMTKIVRGRIVNGAWISGQTLFQADSEDYVDTGFHYGSRITFDDAGRLYFSIGDRGLKEQAQDLSLPNGKVHRINRDGSIPEDNPFVGQENAAPTIYSYGNRNPQGLIWHPASGELWSTEHGPRGGDELNLIESGKNYGWPDISYGINYNGTILTEYTALPGMEQPASHWTPSIAVCGLDVYTGDMFPEWKGRLLVGSLAYESLRLVEVKDGKYLGESEILKAEGRIRDVTTGPDGAIYVALPDSIIRMTPAVD